jgi:hypothetical protein
VGGRHVIVHAAPVFVATEEHPLSPTGVAALLIAGFVIDYFALLPAWLQTRLTFICAVVGFRQGFNDGPLDRFTVERATDIIQLALDQAKGSYIAGAVPLALVGIAVALLSIYTIGMMLPNRPFLSKRLGRFVTVSFKETGVRKISWVTWGLALPLALMAELPQGWLGDATMFAMDLYSKVGSPIPALVFGVV